MMTLPPIHPTLDSARAAVNAYLRAKYPGDLSWHPLFTAMRELWCMAFDHEDNQRRTR